MKKKLLVSLIAVVLVLALSVGIFAACNKRNNNNDDSGSSVPAYPTKTEQQIYDGALSDFNTALTLAKTKKDVDERYAYMALAEAKLLEAAVYVPTTSRGGNYSFGRIAPYSVTPVLFGSDSDRLHNVIVTEELIKPADREALKGIYAVNKGTGTYATKAKAYLAEHGYTVKSTYNYAYTNEANTWDVTDTYRQADSEQICQTYDGLLEYNAEGTLAPALAESYEMSADGLTYTFHIRHGVKWVDINGTERAEVKAQDWVYGMKRILTNKKTHNLVAGIIKNAAEYANGDTDVFAEVGVKATDDYTLVYTLEEPCSYFITMLSYNPFAPVNEAYATTTGDDYGTKYDKILYCGPYLVDSSTPNNSIVFKANPSYWNPSAVQVTTLNWISYNNNKDNTLTYKDVKSGKLDGAGLTTATIPLAKEEKLGSDPDSLFNTYVYTTLTDATAFGVFYNIGRQAYSTDGYDDLTSKQTADQKNLAKWALNNTNFRMALGRAFDRASYNAVTRGADLKLTNLQNMFTPGTFVQLGKAVTLSINGTSKVFAAGTQYGAIVQAQIDADLGADAPKVWDPQADSGIGSSGGYDGWYNPTVAVKFLNKAIEELAAQGVEVSASNPIHIDYPVWTGEDLYDTRSKAFKQNIETVLQGKVVIDIVETAEQDGWLDAGYYCDNGNECNYDIYDVSGWGPDYGDPATYLNCIAPVDGDMIKMLGLW